MSPAGRPEIGTPVNTRLGDELLSRVDAFAAAQEISRAEAIRRLLHRALAPDYEPPYVRKRRARDRRLAQQPNLT